MHDAADTSLSNGRSYFAEEKAYQKYLSTIEDEEPVGCLSLGKTNANFKAAENMQWVQGWQSSESYQVQAL